MFPCASACGASVIEALSERFSRYGCAHTWVTDCGSHFRNSLITSMAEILRVEHHFVTAGIHWANGTIEVANREVLRVTRAMLSEFKLQSNQWPCVVNVIQSALNNAASARLSGRSPIQVFTGHDPVTPLQAIFVPEDLVLIDSTTFQDVFAASLLELNTAMMNLHSSVAAKTQHMADL